MLIQIVGKQPDAPNGTCFHIEEEVEAKNVSNKRCVVRFTGHVVFTKFCFLKAIINSKTNDDIKYFYKTWLKEGEKRQLFPSKQLIKTKSLISSPCTHSNKKPLEHVMQPPGDVVEIEEGMKMKMKRARVSNSFSIGCEVIAVLCAICILAYSLYIQRKLNAMEKLINTLLIEQSNTS